MKFEQIIRETFEPFNNLNLIRLIDNLRDDEWCRHRWYGTATDHGRLIVESMCPRAHGFFSYWRASSESSAFIPYAAFTAAWDHGHITSPELQEVLLQILQERLDDADAVQEVCCQPGTKKTLLTRRS